ncbi:MAG: hypothetical protein SGBAC_010922 [Bacillariaceae sp.]
MTSAQVLVSQRDAPVLTERNVPRCAHVKNNDSTSPPKLVCHDSIALAKKRAPEVVHEYTDASTSPVTEEGSMPPLIRKKSINSLFKEVSLKHGIPESALNDNKVFQKQDSVILSKRRSPGCARGNKDGIACAAPALVQHDSIALAKRRTPKCVHEN